jgi:hypothetical protein
LSSETWVRDTIKAKSDQLNADDLISGPITVKVTGIKQGSADQPVIVQIDGGHQPFKPCKTMRRILIHAWSDRAQEWIGKTLTLYREPTVKWAGEQTGGIRISAMSDIGTEPITVKLQESKGKRATFVIQPIGSSPKREPSLLDKWRPKITALSAAAKALSKPISEAYKSKDASGLAAVETELDALASDEADVLRAFIQDVLEAVQ